MATNMVQSIYPSPPLPQPIAMLILIENSGAMSNIWPDLRDQYLVNLIDNLSVPNLETGAPITVSVLESHPSQIGPNMFAPRQLSMPQQGLRDIQFNYNPENKISAGRIDQSIEFLESYKYSGQPAVLHLIIVAATAPSDDSLETSHAGDYSPWVHLARKMAEKYIHCHIVVSPQNDTGSLTTLFEETNNVEGILYPQVDRSKIVIRVASRLAQHPYSESGHLYTPQRQPRRGSYPSPSDSFYEAVSTTTSADGDGPSLVSQLQQVHGLTKKKVYGAKPARQPFFRDDRVRDKYRSAPTPLTMPLPVPEQTPSPTAGGKVISHSRADRLARMGQGSPTELHARRPHGWPRRGSRLSTPEPDNLAWAPSSPTTYQDASPRSSYISSVSSDMSSPVTPVPMDDIYGMASVAATPTASTSIQGMAPIGSYQTGGMPEPAWPQQQPQYTDMYSTNSAFYPPTAPPPQFYGNSGEYTHKNDQQVLSQQSAYDSYAMDSAPSMMMSPPAVPPVNPPAVQVAPLAPPPPPVSAAPLAQAPAPAPAPTPAPAPRTAPRRQSSAEDDERFTFSPDYFVATATLWNDEVVPSYPESAGLTSGLAHVPRAGPLPMQSSAQPGELFARRHRAQSGRAGQGAGGAPARASYAYGPGYATHAASAYPPQYGSSLTGWAG